MYLRDEEGSGSGYPTDSSKYPDDDEEIFNNGEGSGSGFSDIGTFDVIELRFFLIIIFIIYLFSYTFYLFLLMTDKKYLMIIFLA